MDNKELIFAYNDYQHCGLDNNPPYTEEIGCGGCKARGTFCRYTWTKDNEQWALHILADLSGESLEKINCGYRGHSCTRCTKPICITIFDNISDRFTYRARICDEICAKALEAIQ